MRPTPSTLLVNLINNINIPIEQNIPILPRYAIVDLEVGMTDHRIHDAGALRDDGAVFHHASKEGLLRFIDDVDYLCGHNITHHDV